MAAKKPLIGARRVVVLALPGAFSLDVLGPLEIFKAAAHLLAPKAANGRLDPTDARQFDGHPLAYTVELAGAAGGAVELSSGVALGACRALSELRAPLDTLIVAGGSIARMQAALAEQPELTRHLRRVAKRSRRVASVCTGSFVLAAAGLLDGKRATTHWAACDILERSYPAVRVQRDPIFTRDGSVYTSAGATTGMDLALALVREDYGSQLARRIARWLVLYVERPAAQPQLSVALRMPESEREPIRDLQAYIVEHPGADLSVNALAARVGMSTRNFARAFRREIAATPASYVEAVRVEAARRKLDLGRGSLAQIAAEVGFGSVETLRRAFTRQTGHAPSVHRSRS